jgi:hypothetical protein
VLAAYGRAPPAEPVGPVAPADDPPGLLEPAAAAEPVAAEPVAAPGEAGLGGGGAGRAVDG